ncbi:hypothetical protein NL529_33145, partial [Klebsiella pneumoniae]|nr:hypothetical protein [Klebsiella pneumoniae]
KNEEINQLIKTNQLLKKDAESYLQEQEKSRTEALEAQLKEKMQQLQLEKEKDLQKQLEVLL